MQSYEISNKEREVILDALANYAAALESVNAPSNEVQETMAIANKLLNGRLSSNREDSFIIGKALKVLAHDLRETLSNALLSDAARRDPQAQLAAIEQLWQKLTDKPLYIP